MNLHQNRCETCTHFTLPREWSKLKDCELTRGKLDLIPIGEDTIISIVGCASHSSQTPVPAAPDIFVHCETCRNELRNQMLDKIEHYVNQNSPWLPGTDDRIMDARKFMAFAKSLRTPSTREHERGDL